MINPDKLMKLFALASGKPQPKKEQKKTNNPKTDKIKNSLSTYKGIYNDPVIAWSKWMGDSEKDIDSTNADDIFKHAEDQFPGSPDQARDAIRIRKRQRFDNTDPVVKEQSLRNEMTRSPSWLNEELMPELASTSNQVSNQNLFKAKTVYTKTLEQKLQKMDLSGLDPDVPEEIHIDEMVKLEALNLLDGSKVVNGRLAIMNPNGQIQPAFSMLMDFESKIDINSPEIQTIMNTAPNICKRFISKALDSTKEITGMNNRASSGAALNMLGSGDMDSSQWGEALSLLNGNTSGGIARGVEGLVSQNPNINEEEAMKHATDIYSQYGGMQ